MEKATGIKSLRRGASAVVRRLRRLLPQPPEPAILMYHRIGVESFDPWGLAVAPAHFAEQLEWLARRRTVLPLAEFAAMHGEQRLPRDAVALTFDDAYACNAEIAVPMLERLGLAATLFLPAELIERGEEFWWDDIERIVLDYPDQSLRFEGDDLMLGERQPGDRHWRPDNPPGTPRQRAFHSLWLKLRELEPAALSAAMEQLREQAESPANPRLSHRPMTPDEVKSARSATVEIGAHSLTHPSLPRLSPAEKRHEIVDSVARCAAISGVTPRTMAYPYGDFDAESERIAEYAGFTCACTTEHAFVRPQARAFALPRRQVGDWDARRLAQMLGGA